MLAVMYRVKVKPDCESSYQAAWRKMAAFMKMERGALGSCLHKAENGWFYVYSRWPDQATRARSWPKEMDDIDSCLPVEMAQCARQMKDYVDERLDEIELQVMEDLLS